MITVLTIAFNRYMACEFDKFLAKYILAMGLFELMETYNKKDYSRLKEMELKIAVGVPISVYVADRHVNNTKDEFKTTVNRISCSYKNSTGKTISIELTEDDIWHHLSMLIREVHQIVLRNMKNYQLEQPINDGAESSSPELNNLLNV